MIGVAQGALQLAAASSSSSGCTGWRGTTAPCTAAARGVRRWAIAGLVAAADRLRDPDADAARAVEGVRSRCAGRRRLAVHDAASPLPVVWFVLYTAGPLISLAAQTRLACSISFGETRRRRSPRRSPAARSLDVVVAVVTRGGGRHVRVARAAADRSAHTAHGRSDPLRPLDGRALSRPACQGG